MTIESTITKSAALLNKMDTYEKEVNNKLEWIKKEMNNNTLPQGFSVEKKQQILAEAEQTCLSFLKSLHTDRAKFKNEISTILPGTLPVVEAIQGLI